MTNATRIYSHEGLPRDFEENVLQLCHEAFREDDYLAFELKPRQALAASLAEARFNDLPALTVSADEVLENVNQTGAALGRKQRELLQFRVTVAYVFQVGVTHENKKKLKQVGWALREKLAENTDLFGLSKGADIVSVDYGPEAIVFNDSLYAASCAKITIEYKHVRMRKRAQG